jgi:uncharacterized protein (DUF488 family)
MGTIYTVGHSNRDLEPFLDLLEEFRIGLVADIRRFPSSRKFPHFNRGSLQRSLQERTIGYRWVEAMGGRRHGEDARWQEGLSSPAFRSYAEHMNAGVFREAAAALLEACAETRVAVMCAEKLFWKCHRLLVSDYFVSAGATVIHILEPGRSQEHRISARMRVRPDGAIRYVGEGEE